MGCNTSKESVQPAAEEAKEDVKNGDIRKSGQELTGKSEGSPKENLEGSQERAKNNEANANDSGTQREEEKAAAATRIQAAFRGHHARKSMKETEDPASAKQTAKVEPDPTDEQLRKEFRADDKELCNAATKIQASFRGHMSRKEQATSTIAKTEENLVESATCKIEEKVQDAVNELEGIDLTDPNLHKAATKIQASFRGHKVRQEVAGSPAADADANAEHDADADADATAVAGTVAKTNK